MVHPSCGSASETGLLRKELASLDTGGVTVAQLRATGHAVERYVCPKAQVTRGSERP